jgi:ribonucleoside-diphosphate reductase alpha chain
MAIMAKGKLLSMPKGYSKGKWSPQAIKVLEERYLWRDKRGRIIENPEGMCYRVAREIAGAEINFGQDEKKIENLTKAFYELIVSREFLPNSPTLMNAGKETRLQYSACYVLPVGDSIIEIFNAIKHAALVHQSGGGTGFAFSRLRPKGSVVRRSGGVASGPVSFMRIFDQATQEIKQGGTRRGANMGVLRVDHPDILQFIDCKRDGGITNFNISVGVTDGFMNALKAGKEYQLVAPHDGKVTGKLSAREVFERIVKSAWLTGDPGIIWLDRINQGPANPVPSMGPVEATNPCGEQPLYPFEVCNLGSLNLALMTKGKRKKEVDWQKLEKDIPLAVRFLDNVIEVNPYPIPETDEAAKLNRRIGLGVMGWADLLFQLEIPYSSSKAINLAKKISSFIQKVGHQESQSLAEERGPFPNFEKSIYKKQKPLRNATVTTIAPTGSISVLADCSSGIEPAFALAFQHKTGEREMKFINQYFLEAMKKERVAQSALEEVKEKGQAGGVKEIPAKIKRIFQTAHEISWEDHVKMQSAWQIGTDNAVSKTINFPHETEVKDMEKAFLMAYKSGCLGITVFRDGCKEDQVLYLGLKETGKKKKLEIKPRPEKLQGTTHRIPTPVGNAFVTVNTDEKGEPFEVFVSVGKAGSDLTADAEAIGRLISLNLRSANANTKEMLAQVVDQLAEIGGAASIGLGKNRIKSLPDGIAKILRDFLVNGDGLKEETVSQPAFKFKNGRDLCPACGQGSLIFEEGCSKCLSCGFTKC